MSIVKRAWLYLTRKRGRSILLLVIMFVAAALVMLGLAVKQSADKQADNLRRSLAGSFKMCENEDAIIALLGNYNGVHMPENKRISIELADKILKLPHIKGYYTDMVV